MHPQLSWSRRVAGALAAASLLSAGTAVAQSLRPQIGLAVGRAAPTGDYHAAASNQGFTSGWQAIGLVALSVPGWPVGLRVDGTYGTNSANDQLKADLRESIGQPADQETTLLGANIDLTYARRFSRVQPYVMGGIGAYRVTISVTSAGSTADTSETKFAWNLGAGVGYRLGVTTPFLEARYVDVAPVSGFPGTTLIAIAAGVRLQAP